MEEFISDEFLGSILAEIEKSRTDSGSAAEEGKYITFFCRNYMYAIHILKVKSIQKIPNITPLPKMTESTIGVINLRDEVIPVFDLRRLLGFEKSKYVEKTPVIIIELWRKMKLKRYGLIVDEISGIEILKEEDIQAVPEYIREMNLAGIMGIAVIHNKISILIDIDQLIRNELKE